MNRMNRHSTEKLIQMKNETVETMTKVSGLYGIDKMATESFKACLRNLLLINQVLKERE